MPRDLFAILEAGANPNHDAATIASRRTSRSTFRREYDSDSRAPSPNTSVLPNGLHAYTQTLTFSDVESCVILEAAAFPPNERATREKIEYRLQACPELCFGIYTSGEERHEAVTAKTSSPVDSSAPERRAILLGHIISTMALGKVVTDEDMAYPTLAKHCDPRLGHKKHGRTICVHSLAVVPGFQGQGLGSILLKAFIQRMKSQLVADRIALIAHDYLVPYYENFGFQCLGASQAEFGGGGWYDMVLDLTTAQ